MKLALFALLIVAPSFAQTVFRVDPQAVTTTAGNAPTGGYPALYAVSGSTIALCTNASCTSPATTYTDSTGATACPTNAQVTLPGTSFCTSTTGTQGQFGFWIGAGTYWYTVTPPNAATRGPFPMTSTNTVGVTNVIAGTGIGVSPTVGSVTVTNTGVVTFNGRSGAVTSQGGDYSASQVTNAVDQTQSYYNPSFISSFAWSKLTGLPNLVNAFNGRSGTVVPTSGDYNAGQVTNAVDSTASYANPSWITGMAWSKLTGLPNLVNSFNGRTGVVTPSASDYTYSLIGGTKQGNTNVPQMASGGFISGHCTQYDASGNLVDAGAACGTGGGGGSVTSVFGQTGVVNIPVTTTDISTPANPSAGATKWYTKAGVICSLSPAGAENCVGGASAGVSSLNSLTGALTIAGTSNEITVTPSGSTVTLATPQAIGTSSTPTFGQVSTTGNGFYTGASPTQVIDNSQNGFFHNVTVTGTCTGCGAGGGGISAINSQAGPNITIAGTANQITATTTSNTVTLSTPQNIATSSSPTFAAITINGLITGSASSGSSASFSNNDTVSTLILNNSGSGPSLQAYNSAIFNGGNSGRVDILSTEVKPYTDATVSLGDATYGFKDANIHGVLNVVNPNATSTWNALMTGNSSAEVLAITNSNTGGYGILDGSAAGSRFVSITTPYLYPGSGHSVVTVQGHIGAYQGGSHPTPTVSGGSCTLYPNSTDTKGTFSCTVTGWWTLTFATAFNIAPHCVVSFSAISDPGPWGGTTAVNLFAITSVSNPTQLFFVQNAPAGALVNYQCIE